MNRLLFEQIKKINSSKKDFTKALPIVVIMVLLLIQISVTFYVCRSNDIENYANLMTRSMTSQIARDEGRKKQQSLLSASISYDTSVLEMYENPSPTHEQIGVTSRRIKNLMSISQTVSNIFIYNNEYGYLYDAYGKIYNIDDPYVENIKRGINSYFTEDKKSFMYIDELPNRKEKVCCNIYQPHLRSKNLIIFSDNIYTINDEYAQLQENKSSKVIVTTADDNVVYSTGLYEFNDDISDTNILKAIDNNNTYNAIILDGTPCIVCQTNSAYVNRRFIIITPRDKIPVSDLLGKNYIFLYICILISLLILLRTLSIWKKFSSLLIKQTVLAFGKKKEADKSILYRDYGIPEKGGNPELASYLESQVEGTAYCTAFRLVIGDYTALSEQDSDSDLKLIKYGINNILFEIFGNYNLKVFIANDVEGDLDYIVVYNNKNMHKVVRDAIVECKEAIKTYIEFKTTFFIGSCELTSAISKSYKLLNDVAEYTFVHGSDQILDTSCLRSASEAELSEARELCDVIKKNIDEVSNDYYDNIAKLRKFLLKMNPSQNYETLCYLLFNICSSVKTIEQKHSPEEKTTIADWFKALSVSDDSENILQMVDLLYNDVQINLASSTQSRHEVLVDRCNALIHEEYANPNFSIDYLADKLGFSRGYLGRVYKQISGVSLVSTITDYRLDMAAKLLVETNKKVADIMAEVGLVNGSHFTVQFKQRFGMSPLNYRKNQNSEN